MVKAELERDYYADLELQPSATANDVKKQFKKLALQYHPDRNPAADATTKFQSIQSANEILTDPQQRAKYDAQRIRNGLLHNYNEPPPPPPRNGPSRSPTGSKFPPPPRPPPMRKPNLSPPRSGAQKYTRFSTPDPPTWRTKDADDAKSKTNDFKAWEHMRHGQGPIPRGRKDSSAKTSKPTSFQPGRQDHTGHNSSGTMPKRTAHRHTEWENLPDAGAPNIQRSNTTRMPPKPFTYVPSTPGAGNDESPARSAYATFSRDRPSAPRAQTHMPPPPARAPTAKKPDPMQAFKAQMGATDPLKSKQRVHVEYPRVYGEKTNLGNPGLQRSSTTATPRESNSRTGFHDSDSLHADSHHARSASASSPRPTARAAGMASVSTTSSDTSSDEEEAIQKKEAANLKSAFDRPKQNAKTRRPNIGAGAPQRSFFNPYVTVDEAKDEHMVSDAAYSGPRRHSEIGIPTHERADEPPEGFMEHRKKHVTEQSHQQASGVPIGSRSPHLMQRPRSFDEKYSRSPRSNDPLSPNPDDNEKTPMYDPGYIPFSLPSQGPSRGLPRGPPSGLPFGSPSLISSSSEMWSEHWPFGSLKRPQHFRVGTPPYWAIPSTVPAPLNPHARQRSSTHVTPPTSSGLSPIDFAIPPMPSPTNFSANAVLDPFTANTSAAYADHNSLPSFRWPVGDMPKAFAHTPPLRSQSTENIDLRFSPSGNPPRFGGASNVFPGPSGTTSDDPIHVRDQEKSVTGQDTTRQDRGDESSPERTPCDPPPKGPACFFSNDWHHRPWAGTFSPDRSQSRNTNQRRTGTSRASSVNAAKRAGPNRATGFQPSVNEAADEPPAYTSASENLSSSRVSSEGSAMDIDPVLTPPSGNDNQQQLHSNDVSPMRRNEVNKTWKQGPTLPPRTAFPVQAEKESLDLNMGDLKHVKPFGPNTEGLNNVDDLSQALPFESRASSTRPPTEKGSQVLKMPNPPKPPSPPNPLNITTWDSYLRAMTAYMSSWSIFNNTMLSHFHIRQEAQKQMNPGWMHAQGDNEYNTYLESTVEDEKVRKWWEVACEHHKECIQKLGEVRLAMKAEITKVQTAAQTVAV